MAYYQKSGEIPHARHTQFRQPSGELFHEELIGATGFDGDSSLLYHLAPPTRVRAIEAASSVELREHAGDVLRHHRFETMEVSRSGDFQSARVPALFNSDIVISVATPDRASEAFYRNGDCDELVYVHQGDGELRTPFGAISYNEFDWIYIPRTTIVEWRPRRQDRLVIIESTSMIRPPSRYLSERGQFLEIAPYCERDIRPPELLPPLDEPGEHEIRVKSRGRVTSYWVDRHPFDVVGWDGCFYPYAINSMNFQPFVHSVHTMPNMHQIFTTDASAICNFVPRPTHFHPLGIAAAPNHSSVDCDEVLYLAGGELSGRVGDGSGTMTFHPRGIPHGPKPGTYENSIALERHSATALMVDTFQSLKVAQPIMECDDASYPQSWTAQ